MINRHYLQTTLCHSERLAFLFHPSVVIYICSSYFLVFRLNIDVFGGEYRQQIEPK